MTDIGNKWYKIFVNIYLLSIRGTAIDPTKIKTTTIAIHAHFQLHLFQDQLGLFLAGDLTDFDERSSFDAKNVIISLPIMRGTRIYWYNSILVVVIM